MKGSSAAFLACILLVAAVPVAVAQQFASRSHGPRISAGVEDLPLSGAIASDSMVLPLVGATDHLEGRLAFLKAELKITGAQAPLWNAFTAAIRANASQTDDMMEKEMSPVVSDQARPSLPQRLEADEKRLTTHLNMLHRVAAAFLPLYASFSDEQRQAAEALVGATMGL